jgi:CheY-like chemotaxis protein
MEKPVILLLERDATVIDVALRNLAGEMDLHIAKTLDLALRVVARKSPAVVVLDVEMAGGTPTDIVGKLRARHPRIRIVFLAAAAFNLDRRYTQLGCVLRKPVTGDRLASAIRNALRFAEMSAGVERMHSSSNSGTFAAVRPPEEPPGGVAAGPAPEAPEPRTEAISGEHPRVPVAHPPGRSFTPRAFARVR